MIDQSPVGVNAGYTWISDNYRRVFAASAKVTNGDSADGSEILTSSNRNSKDAWVDLDFWFAPESGVTFINYYGKKDQNNANASGTAFTFHPVIRRQGVFANYMFKYTADLSAGYLHSHDGWLSALNAPAGTFVGNDYFVGLDYYIQQGFAVSGRFDRVNQQITGVGGVGKQNTHDWTIGVNKTFTPSGNIIGRIAYSNLSGRDPVAAVKSTDRLVQADISLNF